MADIRLTEEQLQTMLAAAAESGAKAAVAAFGAMPPAGTAAPASPRQSEQETFEAMTRDIGTRPLKAEQRIPCITDRGTRFVAVVAGGKVVSLENYEYPTFVQDGKPLTLNELGQLCIPAPEFIQTGKGLQPNPVFRHLKWRECFQRDLLRYVGHDARELPRAIESHDRAAE